MFFTGTIFPANSMFFSGVKRNLLSSVSVYKRPD